jgi:hypothetical protein
VEQLQPVLGNFIGVSVVPHHNAYIIYALASASTIEMAMAMAIGIAVTMGICASSHPLRL